MSSIRERFEAEMPGHFFLSEDIEQVGAYLIEQGVMPRKRLMKKGATIDRIEPIALGEMDYAVRVYFGEGAQPHGPTVLVKQSRPWVEGRPEVKAPVSRSRAEAGYLKMVSRVPALAKASPSLIHHDMANHVMVLHDLGEGERLNSLRTVHSVSRENNGGQDLISALVGYLNTLHAHFLRNPPLRPVVNKGMRKLNHEQLFVLPFQGSSAFAKTTDPAILRRVDALGERFFDFKAGGTLLHGAFRPSNFWVENDEQKTFRIIEPSSCLSGPPEFDFGIFVAHLHLGGHASRIEQVQELYTSALDNRLWRGYAGVELMRCLVAGDQELPNNLDLDALVSELTAYLLT